MAFGLSTMAQEDKIVSIAVKGNQRIEAEVVLQALVTKVGDVYQPRNLARDIRAIFETGHFKDIQVDVQDTMQGKAVIFIVQEKPLVRAMSIDGNEKVKTKEINEVIENMVNQPLDLKKVIANQQKVTMLYSQKGYSNVVVDFDFATLPGNEVEVKYLISENIKVYIKQIRFVGNDQVDTDDLEDQIYTKKYRFFLSWFTNRGVFQKEIFDNDILILEDYYKSRGFLEVKIDAPQVEYKKDGIYITVNIKEGKQYKVGHVSYSGRPYFEQQVLQELVKTKFGEIFNVRTLRADIDRLTVAHQDVGYFNADVSPRMKRDAANQVVDLDFHIEKGTPVRIEEIVITGNEVTRDKVIRREVVLREGDLLGTTPQEITRSRLERLQFFEEVSISTRDGSAEDLKILEIDVKEQRTGYISFGAMASSQSGVTGLITLAQRNLFGRGQRIALNASLGSDKQRFEFNFREPHLLDTNVRSDLQAYSAEEEYQDFDKDSTGGALKFTFPLARSWSGWARYALEETDISNVNLFSAQLLRDQADMGAQLVSSGQLGIARDTRDNRLDPSEGTLLQGSVELAGEVFGGDQDFVRVSGGGQWHTPLPYRFVMSFNAEGGFVDVLDDKPLFLSERYFLGGIKSVRGYESFSLGAIDALTGDVLGGNKYLQFNVEFKFPIPLLDKFGFKGVFFYDAGNAFDQGEEIGTLQQSVGGELRWLSPLGPLRFSYGIPLNPRAQDDDAGLFDFTMGSVF